MKKLIKAVSNLQQAHAALGFPPCTLLCVGIVSGRAIALSCELDLGKLFELNLEIVRITLEKRLRLLDLLLPAQGSMKYQFVLGYVSDLVLKEDQNAIKCIKIIRFPGRKIQCISPGLFIHVYNKH